MGIFAVHLRANETSSSIQGPKRNIDKSLLTLVEQVLRNSKSNFACPLDEWCLLAILKIL